MSDEQQLRLKPPGEGGCSSYYHAALGIGASQDNPVISVSDAAYDILLETGRFEAVESDGDEAAAEDAESERGDGEGEIDGTEDDGTTIGAEAFDHDDEDGSEAEAESEDTDICGTEMSSGEVCERPADECPYHQDDEDEDEDAEDDEA